MQILGFLLLGFVIWFGFTMQNGAERAVSAFDPHALVMVLLGSLAAVLISSSMLTALRTLGSLRELIPGLRRFSPRTREMKTEYDEICDCWREGKRSSALAIADKSASPAIRKMLDLIVGRAPDAERSKVFLDLRHDEIERWQPAIGNWEMLSKLGPAFGMVGTITGMIQMFKNMSSENLNLGSSMSLALLATLYGVAFGAGIAGPIANYLNNLLDQRLGLIERCEKSAHELVSWSGSHT